MSIIIEVTCDERVTCEGASRRVLVEPAEQGCRETLVDLLLNALESDGWSLVRGVLTCPSCRQPRTDDPVERRVLTCAECPFLVDHDDWSECVGVGGGMALDTDIATRRDPDCPMLGSTLAWPTVENDEAGVGDVHPSATPDDVLLTAGGVPVRTSDFADSANVTAAHVAGDASCTVGECYFMRGHHALTLSCRVVGCNGVLHAVATDWSDYSYEQGVGPVGFRTECDRCGDVRDDDGFRESDATPSPIPRLVTDGSDRMPNP